MKAERIIRLTAENEAEAVLLTKIKRATQGGQAILPVYFEVTFEESRMLHVWPMLEAAKVVLNDR